MGAATTGSVLKTAIAVQECLTPEGMGAATTTAIAGSACAASGAQRPRAWERRRPGNVPLALRPKTWCSTPEGMGAATTRVWHARRRELGVLNARGHGSGDDTLPKATDRAWH